VTRYLEGPANPGQFVLSVYDKLCFDGALPSMRRDPVQSGRRKHAPCSSVAFGLIDLDVTQL
jgi:hypothetical protein